MDLWSPCGVHMESVGEGKVQGGSPMPEEHMHAGCGHFNHSDVTDCYSCKFQLYYMTKSHGSYLCSIYILLRNIFSMHD